ncbi:hypothetical protein OEZ86_012284 [Tetradesmus obliquus]|nr:hypothetical protein OEZ86_012284 [Tetradesmus obliquus]
MDLWHLYTEHDNKRQARLAAAGAAQGGTAQLPAEAPRLLTAEEEAALGSVVQQYRKLVQLHRDFPEAAAALDPPADLGWPAGQAGPPSSSNGGSSSSSSMFAGPADAAVFFSTSGSDSSSSSSEASSPSSSPSSSRRSSTAGRAPVLGLDGKRVHANTKWPPPLSDADVQEVTSMSRAWRAMLPELAAKAQQLVVLYNTRLVPHMLHFLRRTRPSSQLPSDDLLSVGLVGLRRAAARYDPGRKTRFSTVATVWILQSMQRATDEEFGSFRAPHRHHEILRHVLQRYGPASLEQYQQQTGMLQQVAAAFKTKPATVLQALRSTVAASNTASLDSPSYSGPASAKGDDSNVPWSALLTSTDLDDEDGEPGMWVIGVPGT